MKKYIVGSYSWDRHPNKRLIGKTSKFIVTDDANNEARTIATFDVNDAYPEEHQMKLAEILRDFLNNRIDAVEKTFEDNALLQRIIL